MKLIDVIAKINLRYSPGNDDYDGAKDVMQEYIQKWVKEQKWRDSFDDPRFTPSELREINRALKRNIIRRVHKKLGVVRTFNYKRTRHYCMMSEISIEFAMNEAKNGEMGLYLFGDPSIKI